MKKISTLVAVLALGAMVQVNAENRYWDFTNWSAETVANLKAGADWSDIEKADGDAPTEMSKENCFWQVNATENVNADGYLTANGVVISELVGLKYTNTANRSFAIAVNYPDVPNDGFGPYAGGSYIWLGSSNKDYFIIPAVEPGTKIKMGVESHKKSDARGVRLYVGAGHEGTEVLSPEGTPVAIPTTYQDIEWMVPADLTAPTDIQIFNTNGCHIYYIALGDAAGISGIVADEDAPAVYYNLQGVEVANPDNGIYICRKGNKVSKVIF